MRILEKVLKRLKFDLFNDHNKEIIINTHLNQIIQWLRVNKTFQLLFVEQ